MFVNLNPGDKMYFNTYFINSLKSASLERSEGSLKVLATTENPIILLRIT